MELNWDGWGLKLDEIRPVDNPLWADDGTD
jgi:hypothetical protein